MMQEKHTITMANGTKIHMTLEPQKEGTFWIGIDDVETPKPKVPEYKYSAFEPNLTQPMNLPLEWRKNKDGLPVYLHLVRFTDNNGKYSVALAMTDSIGRVLEGGVLLKFKENDELARLIPIVGDQYPGERGLNGEIALGLPECLPVE